LLFIRRDGELLRRHGWCAESGFDARIQVNDGIGHVSNRVFQAVEGLVNKVIRVAQPRTRMSVWCLGVVGVRGGMGVCC